jgi:hypothetical protein
VVGVNQVFPKEGNNKGGNSRLCLPDGSTVWRADATEVMKVLAVQLRPSQNRPPTVDAGDVQTIRLPRNAVALRGYAIDDGKPRELKTNWTQVSGPAPMVIDRPGSANTSVTVSQAGVYLLRLIADDGELSSSSYTWINVLPADGSELGLTGRWDFNGNARDSSVAAVQACFERC